MHLANITLLIPRQASLAPKAEDVEAVPVGVVEEEPVTPAAPEPMPELDADIATPPDSPAPETPPTTHIELDVFNLTHKGDGPLTHMVKEVEECWAEWHHVDEHGIRTDGEVGIVGGISPI